MQSNIFLLVHLCHDNLGLLPLLASLAEGSAMGTIAIPRWTTGCWPSNVLGNGNCKSARENLSIGRAATLYSMTYIVVYVTAVSVDDQ